MGRNICVYTIYKMLDMYRYPCTYFHILIFCSQLYINFYRFKPPFWRPSCFAQDYSLLILRSTFTQKTKSVRGNFSKNKKNTFSIFGRIGGHIGQNFIFTNNPKTRHMHLYMHQFSHTNLFSKFYIDFRRLGRPFWRPSCFRTKLFLVE